jgi:pimeloyl-ACP methyl ester carboxylesterase
MNKNHLQNDNQATSAVKSRRNLGCFGRGAIGVAIFLVVILVVGLIYQAAASASDIKEYPPPGKLYDVGDYQLHLYCTGEGSPTVILEAGAGNPGFGWSVVQSEVEGFARVCSYDRPGFGWSDSPANPLTREQVVSLLHELLKVANVPGPYILVGHSAGGEYIRAYTRQYPSEVLGMVLVDSSHESETLRYPEKFLKFNQYQLMTQKICLFLSPLGMVRLISLWDTFLPESLTSTEVGKALTSTLYRTGYCKAAYAEAVALASPGQPGEPGSLGDLPLIVISAGAIGDNLPNAVVTAMGGPDVVAHFVQVHDEFQQELAGLSTEGELIVAQDSGHEIHWYQPELVIDAISTVIAQVGGQ